MEETKVGQHIPLNLFRPIVTSSEANPLFSITSFKSSLGATSLIYHLTDKPISAAIFCKFPISLDLISKNPLPLLNHNLQFALLREFVSFLTSQHGQQHNLHYNQPSCKM